MKIKMKSVIVILLMVFLSSVAVAEDVTVMASESTLIEMLEETSEKKGSESLDELKLFYDRLFAQVNLGKFVRNFQDVTFVFKTIPQDFFRPPIFS